MAKGLELNVEGGTLEAMLCEVCGALSFVSPRRLKEGPNRCRVHRQKRLRARVVSKAKTKDGASERAIRDENDDLVRRILRLRGGSCVNFGCAQREGLQVGHYIKRGVLALRWDLRNCNLQCDFHNAAHNEDLEPYKHSMILRYGIGITWQIELTAEENPRLEYSDLLEIRDGLRRELAAYQRKEIAA